jgi:hypothetical protein
MQTVIAHEIAQALTARIESLCATLLPNGHRDGAEWRCGSIQGETGGSLGVHLRGAKAGIWRDFAADQGGDALDLVAAVKGHTIADAIRWSIDWLGLPAPTSSAKTETARGGRDERRDRRALAQWLWRCSCAATGTIVETYLRSRGITCSLPATIRSLKSQKSDHRPAMICAYGIPEEPEPSILRIPTSAIYAVHLTLLKTDGSGNADIEPNKITIGSPLGQPIVLAPLNDFLGLLVTEGIEEALSLHVATGLGAWAAGSASYMPALAPSIPDYTDCVTVVADPDEAGRRNAPELIRRLRQRGHHVEHKETSYREIAA